MLLQSPCRTLIYSSGLSISRQSVTCGVPPQSPSGFVQYAGQVPWESSLGNTAMPQCDFPARIKGDGCFHHVGHEMPPMGYSSWWGRVPCVGAGGGSADRGNKVLHSPSTFGFPTRGATAGNPAASLRPFGLWSLRIA